LQGLPFQSLVLLYRRGASELAKRGQDDWPAPLLFRAIRYNPAPHASEWPLPCATRQYRGSIQLWRDTPQPNDSCGAYTTGQLERMNQNLTAAERGEEVGVDANFEGPAARVRHGEAFRKLCGVGERPQRRDTPRRIWVRADWRGRDGRIRQGLRRELNRREIAANTDRPGSRAANTSISRRQSGDARRSLFLLRGSGAKAALLGSTAAPCHPRNDKASVRLEKFNCSGRGNYRPPRAAASTGSRPLREYQPRC